MTTASCPCGTPVNGVSLCPNCHSALQIALADVSAHWIDLDTVKARQTRYGGTGGGRGGEKPLPVDARFLGWEADGSRLQEAVKNTIGTWGRAVMEERPVFAGPTHDSCLHVTCSVLRRSRTPRSDVPAYCRYMLGQADWIRTQHWAPEILDELTDAAEQLRRMVDRPAERWFAGPCDTCKRDLYAKTGKPSVTCDECAVVYDLAARREWLLDQAQEKLLTAAELSRAVSWLGSEPLTAARIWKWAQRGRITARGHITVRGKLDPIYLVGDVIAALALSTRPKAG